MKRILFTLASVALIALVVSVAYLAGSSRNIPQLNGARLVQAVRGYSADLKARGVPAPATVSLDELIERGFLDRGDVAAFEGLSVQIGLAADESRPGDVFARVQLPDGGEIVLLADGSVQQVGP
ncbi:MAG: hypothetical protein AB7O66_17615 [Limisphaerales bacterium]